jgi:hypothetical protein
VKPNESHWQADSLTGLVRRLGFDRPGELIAFDVDLRERPAGKNASVIPEAATNVTVPSDS